jgi:hypothetical protein
VLAQLLTGATIVAIGAMFAAIIVSLLPSRLRTAIPVLLVGTAATATVAFGTDIAGTLPARIMATHAAEDMRDGLHQQIPQLDRLADVDPLIEYELSVAFHTAYLTGSGSEQARAVRAGQDLGLAIHQAFLRKLSRLSDHSARRLISLERQTFELLAQLDPNACGARLTPGARRLDAAQDARLRDLRRALLRAKVQALADLEEKPELFDMGDRAAFEAKLRADAASLHTPDDSRCGRMLAFYDALQHQPSHAQGKWVRSRQIFPAETESPVQS